MKNTKTVWLSGFRNVVPVDYENWIEQLALQGWNIDHIGQWNSIVMTFHRSDPKKYRYIYDLQAFPKKECSQPPRVFGGPLGRLATTIFINLFMAAMPLIIFKFIRIL